MTKRKGSGNYPADCAPVYKEKAPRGIDDLGTRLDNMAVSKTTRLERLKAARYLHRLGEREVAECLGVVDFYDRLVAIQEEEAVAALQQADGDAA